MKRAYRSIFALLVLAGVTWSTPSQAGVTSIVIDGQSPAYGGASVGDAGPYETLVGRAFGELNPNDAHNSIIQDIALAPQDASGLVHYVTTFQINMPVNPGKLSAPVTSTAAVVNTNDNGLLIYEVSNRGGTAMPTTVSATVPGAIYLQSGWQGDLLANCTTAYPCESLANGPYDGAYGNQVLQVPVATNSDGTSITGPVYGHIVPGAPGFQPVGNTAQMVIKSTPIPYKPASLDPSQAQLWSVTSQSVFGVDGTKTIVPSTEWAWADCRTVPFPGTPDPTRICMQNGFDPTQLYEMVFTAKDPLVLGIGYAATRDLISFFHHATADSTGTPNPLAGRVLKVLSVGASQSGAFIRSSIHLGFNQDENNAQVLDGAWPQIDGRQLYLNVRFALPNVDGTLYMSGHEAPMWWADYPNLARNLPAAGMLDRCTASKTCPQILETNGAEEFYDLLESPDYVGMTAVADIPLPANVHRYYFPGVTHGGGGGGFSYVASPPPASGCTLPANPNPESDTNDALQDDFIAFVMHGMPMPASVYPKLSAHQLVAPTQAATGYPNIPGFPYAGVYNPVLEYNFGTSFDYNDQKGYVTIQPPQILEVLPTYVAAVGSDGNEPNTIGVASVLHQAPLGTYNGWNVSATPAPGAPFAGQVCVNTGSFIPFAETIAERIAARDPRLSLEERYGSHTGYVCAVTLAANRAVSQRFLRASAAATLIAEAQASNVLTDLPAPTAADASLANAVCHPPVAVSTAAAAGQ